MANWILTWPFRCPRYKDAKLANLVSIIHESVGYWMSCMCHKSNENLEPIIGEVFIMVEKLMEEHIMTS